MPSQKDSWIENRRHVKGYGKGINCYIPRSTLRLLERVCAACGEGDSSILTVHHIDGDPTNNLIENLQVLCPNCHCITTSPDSIFAGSLASMKSRYKQHNQRHQAPDLTIRDYLSCHLPRYLSGCRTFCDYASRLASLGGLRVKDVTHERLTAVFAEMEGLGASRAEIRQVGRTISTALKRTLQLRQLNALPCPLPLPGIRCLTSLQETELSRTLQKQQSNGRPWTAAAVSELVLDSYGVRISLFTAWHYLCRSETPYRRQRKAKLRTRRGERADDSEG